jgi:outer membrane protein OmpA-like peptidoglycan-associated protein
MHKYFLVPILIFTLNSFGQEYQIDSSLAVKITQIKKDTILNLVPNFSFEKFSECPDGCSIIPKSYFVDDWIMATLGTPDYFNACSNKSGVPNNWVGKLYAKSGNGYAGLIAGMYINGNGNLEEKREYIEASLKSKLIKDIFYYLGFSTSLAGNSPVAINGLGMFLSDTLVDIVKSIEHLPFTPQLLNRENKIISEQHKWTELGTIYKAKGNEQFIIIGNFQPDDETSMKPVNSRGSLNCSYYLIDDVFVLPLADIQNLQTIRNNKPKEKKAEVVIINFGFDSFLINDFNKLRLDSLKLEILNNNISTIEISGFTDNIGSENYNLGLSEKRANTVAVYLKSFGGNKIIIKGFGKKNPVADNTSEKSRGLNRRVEIRLY